MMVFAHLQRNFTGPNLRHKGVTVVLQLAQFRSQSELVSSLPSIGLVAHLHCTGTKRSLTQSTVMTDVDFLHSVLKVNFVNS